MRFSAKRQKHVIILAGILIGVLFLFAGPAAAAGGGGETKGWIATDTYRVINFSILFVALFLVLRKPVAKALGARIEGIKEQLAELEAQKAAAEKQLTEYNEKLARLDEEAKTIVEEYIKQGNEAKARIIKAAEETAVKLEEQAKRNIDNEFKKVKESIQAEVMEQALAKAEQLVRDKINDEDQNRLVDDYLEKVVA